MKAKYIGNGAYLMGIPARDLFDADWNALSKEQREAVIKSDLYEIKQVKLPAKDE